VKYYVNEERVLDRIAANLVCAVALEKAEYELKGSETAEDYARVLSDVEGLDSVVESDFQSVVDDLDEHGPSHPLKRWFLDLALTRIVRKAGEWLHGVDVRVLALVFVEHPNLDEYLAEQGQPPAALVLFATQLEALRRETILFVNGTVYLQVALGLLPALGVPLLLMGVFRLVVRLCKKKEKTPASPSGATTPEEPSTKHPPPSESKPRQSEGAAC